MGARARQKSVHEIARDRGEGVHWGLIKSVGGFFVKRRKARGEGQGCPSDAL